MKITHYITILTLLLLCKAFGFWHQLLNWILLISLETVGGSLKTTDPGNAAHWNVFSSNKISVVKKSFD